MTPERELLFHLAVPCRDLDEAAGFYNGRLGCPIARRYEDRVTFDFFGHQLVCHLAPAEIDDTPEVYPRHFGVTFLDRRPFDDVLRLVRRREIPLLREPSTRFQGSAEEHVTLLLAAPSNNVIEFKHYADPRMRY